MKMRILLTGASGNVGIEVLRMLVQSPKDYEVVAFDVENEISRKKLTPYQNKAKIVFGDITQKEDVEKACKNIDFTIHLAAIIPPKADEFTELAQRVNVEGTRNIVEALEHYSPDSFIAYSSSVSVYGDRVKTPMIKVTDALSPSPRDYYATTKIASEEIIQNSNLRWTIFRLSAIMGAGNHKMSHLMFHMPLNTSVEITIPEDTGRAFVNAIEHQDELESKIFNLGGGEKNRTSYKNLLAENFKCYGLGEFNLPEKAFAEKNFHCGFYADGDDLENIVSFRQDTLQSYVQKVCESVNPIQRFFTRLVSPIAKKFLLKKSEPWIAYKQKNQEEMSHYFN
ncbi:NAD(P)-dependent oxidoreductase [Ornithobacterium rhinotracheale]|nr:NAD(P)-dependent oxidoreductase [Ornithobacterium rhinotracheale]MRJ11013.1 NAD(P)-dependent oxidoreductase [Ornithobacterium rhinotracheale]